MSDRDTAYMRYRVLTNHSAQLLQIGDKADLPGKPSLISVKEVKRLRSGGSTVTLENGFVFDPSHEMYDNITIWRPLRKFSSALFDPSPVRREEFVEDSNKKNRSTRKKAGTRK
jgi:hypothetical protein